MHYTIERLLKGERDIVAYYGRADELWAKLLEAPSSVAALAAEVTRAQLRFEKECGGRWLGQEVMAIVGIARHYSTTDGFGNRARVARRVYLAIRASRCSIEVKAHADNVARSYDLLSSEDEEQDEAEDDGDEEKEEEPEAPEAVSAADADGDKQGGGAT